MCDDKIIIFMTPFFPIFSTFRVFKKSSSNGKITVYLGKRDFVDHLTHVDPIGKSCVYEKKKKFPLGGYNFNFATM